MCPRDQLRSCVGGSALLILFPFILAFSLPAARAQRPQNQAREYERDGRLALEQENYAAAVRDFQLTLNSTRQDVRRLSAKSGENGQNTKEVRS